MFPVCTKQWHLPGLFPLLLRKVNFYFAVSGHFGRISHFVWMTVQEHLLRKSQLCAYFRFLDLPDGSHLTACQLTTFAVWMPKKMYSISIIFVLPWPASDSSAPSAYRTILPSSLPSPVQVLNGWSSFLSSPMKDALSALMMSICR